MSGWSGGVSNRTWQRDRRGDGRAGAVEEVQQILAKFRAEHDYEPGMVWDPCRAQYVLQEQGAP